MYASYSNYCTKLQDTDKYRKLPEVNIAPTIDFGTNDYLSLSHNEELLLAATIAGRAYGVGSTGSRLLSGNKKIFDELEHQIAIDKGEEAALIFNSGFIANTAALSSLLDKQVLGSVPLVFFDRLNHSSLYQAVALSGAELVRYKHNDMQDLSELLTKFHSDTRPKFIVTETLFGMDGDILPIHDILMLAQKHRTFVYLDEAHATGIFGSRGYGLSTDVDFQDIPHLVMGTFSKALGSFGGYVACSHIIKNYLINKAQGFIYSTALSPMVIGASLKAWLMVKDFDMERKDLLSKAAKLRHHLQEQGFDTGLSTSHIIPIILGKEEVVMRAKESLLRDGIALQAIRPPTVPSGSSRLRIALNTSHRDEDIAKLIDALKNIGVDDR